MDDSIGAERAWYKGAYASQFARVGTLWAPEQIASITEELMIEAGLTPEQELPAEAFLLWDNVPMVASSATLPDWRNTPLLQSGK
jgi:hypothetical protein